MNDQNELLEPIAIVGMGGIFPGSSDVAGYWDNILRGKNSIIEVPRDRWDWRLYYDADPSVPDKTYSKIGGFVTDFKFDPLKLRIPTPVAQQMDQVQKMAVVATAEALRDSGYDKKPYDSERAAVILGNSMGGAKKETTDVRVYTAFYQDQLACSQSFLKLSPAARKAIQAEVEVGVKSRLGTITEDTMPGELSNVIAGRVANVFNFNGANFTVDAACASSLAALDQAAHGLRAREYDMVFCGGVDQMMTPPAYVKFCKIGALSPDGSRPFDAGANGFVMGEGGGVLALKRLSDALRDSDKIYALIRAVGSSSDGRGKGITAPNPKGQKLAMERTFRQLDYTPADVGLLEAHGTSTKVGDVVEANTAAELFHPYGLKPGSVGLGSVKSQVGHLKAAAGIASLVKAALALERKTLPPSINFRVPNPGIDWKKSPFFVVTEAREWASPGRPRRANVSSFGFGGTNFHVALEEATPGTIARWERAAASARSRVPAEASPSAAASTPAQEAVAAPAAVELPPAIVNADPALAGESFFIHGATPDAVFDRLQALQAKAAAADGPLAAFAYEVDTHARGGEYSLCFAAESGTKLREKIEFILRAKSPALWQKTPPLFRAKGIYLGRRKKPGKIGFMFPGQGSQYIDMLKDLRGKYRVVHDTFAEADEIMQEFAGYRLTEVLFTRGGESPEQLAAMEEKIKQTEITQPAVLTADIAILRLLASYGVSPDVVVGHSLGEYGALVAAGVLTFREALLAVSARGKEMAGVKVDDPGKMASVAAPMEKIEPVLKQIHGYVAPANKNCPIQTVIAGESHAVDAAVKKFNALGVQAQQIRVSHAFHSKIVALAQKPYAKFLGTLKIQPPRIPVLSNVTAAYYPEDPRGIRELMVAQIASSVEFIRQTERMYKDGVRLFVEVGPKRVLTAFVTSTLEGRADAVAMSSNHPKRGGILEFNDLLARLEAENIRLRLEDKDPSKTSQYCPGFSAWVRPPAAPSGHRPAGAASEENASAAAPSGLRPAGAASEENASAAAARARSAPAPRGASRAPDPAAFDAELREKWGFHTGPVVVSGIAAGTPGAWDRVFREGNLDDILRGQNLIGKLGDDDLQRQIDKNIVRLIKSATGDHRLERIESAAEVIHLAATAGQFDLAKEFGFKESIAHAMDLSTKLGVAAGILALRDAGIPLVSTYKETTTGSSLHTGWALPAALRQETGIIFASAFPTLDSMISEVSRYLADKYRRKPLRELASLLESLIARLHDPNDRAAVESWYAANFRAYQDRYGDQGPYEFSRDFLLKAMPLGHSQLAQWIGSRGPATQISAACASTTQAVAMAEDWIRVGRARRVIVIAGDDVTSPTLREWVLTGFLAAGAATTSSVVSESALPFDRRRHGMIVGMGAAGLVVEAGEKTAERGMRPLTEILSSQYENSSFHVMRLHVEHVSEVMDRLVAKAERRFGIDRREIAPKTLFMSHETYTPARGGSAAAEVQALKRTFGPDAMKIVVTNTKGFTGHSMGASIEDPIAIHALVTGVVPPIANYKIPDPELAGINLSRGGVYDLEYAIRLGAGFGSQIAMTLMRRVLKKGENRVADPARHQQWLQEISGRKDPQLEIVHNTLRVRDTRVPASSTAAPVPEPLAPIDVPETASAGARPSSAAPVLGGMTPPRAAAKENNPAAVAAALGPTLDEKEVQATVVRVVSEKTGYPPEMLELDLDMEADLGIDTVKQAELFGMVRERYAIPRREGVALKDYPTLRHVIRFVLESSSSVEPSSLPAPSAGSNGGNGAPTATAVPEARLGRSPSAPGAGLDPAPAAGSAGPPLDSDEVRAAVTALVSEKTGYPPEMLELDLDMEADLGIDTVKQAEMFGLLREKYSIPRREGVALKDYPTLRHLIRFILESRGPAAAASTAVELAPLPSPSAGSGEMGGLPAAAPSGLRPAGAAAEENGPAAAPAARIAAGTAAEENGPAAEFRRWVLEAYERPLSGGGARELAKDKVVLILGADANAAKPFAREFESLGVPTVAVAKLAWKDSEEAAKALRKAAGGKPVQGLLYLRGLGLGAFDASRAAEFDPLYRDAVRPLFLAAKALQADLGADGAWLATATCMGGDHGIAPEKASKTAFHPAAGALTGLAKALRKELPKARVAIVDFDAAETPKRRAEGILEELRRGDGRAEIGRRKGRRLALRLVPGAVSGKPAKLSAKSVALVTGGGQGLGAECAKELARRHRCRLVVLGRTPLEPKAAQWAALGAEGLSALKKELWEKLKADKTKKATPALLEREYSKVTKAAALHQNLEEMRRSGSETTYLAVDLADPAQVRKALKDLKVKPDVVLHAAGLEESKLLADKTPERFDAVFAAKAHGALHLLEAVPEKAGQAWIFFSSVVGRFGNAGQTDYAAASDFLAKLSARLRREGRRAVTVDLTAISELGMATRGSTEQFLKSQGVDFMPPALAVRMILEEVERASPESEVLLAARLGRIDPDGQMIHPSGGSTDRGNGGKTATTVHVPTPARKTGKSADERLAKLPAEPGEILADAVLSKEAGSVVTAKRFSLDSDPWLKDHSIGGVPYVAGVMGLELFAETAALLSGAVPRGFSDVRFALPIKLLRDKPITVRAHCGPGGRELRIESDFLTPQGIKLGAPRVHFTAKALESPDSDWDLLPKPSLERSANFAATPREIYAAYFHGPSFQVLAGIASVSEKELLAVYREPEKPLWRQHARRLAFCPMLVEAAFQACGYRDLRYAKKMTLPDSVGAVRVWDRGRRDADAPMYVRAVHRGVDAEGKSLYDACVFDRELRLWVELKDYRMIPVS